MRSLTRVIPAVKKKRSRPNRQKAVSGRKAQVRLAEVAALILVAAVYATFELYVNVPEIQMPNVEGSTLEEARANLQSHGFKNIQENRNHHPTIPPENVISQDPPPDTMVKVTRNVTLTISRGPEYRTVPEVIGYTLSDARIKISQHELIVYEPYQEKYINDYPVGVVMDKDPKPETNLSKGSGVTLYVSNPAPVSGRYPTWVNGESCQGIGKSKVKNG